MGKKLLFLIFILVTYLSPSIGWAQCPTSVQISANPNPNPPGTTVCSEDSVTFTATPTGGTNLEYEWFIGSSSVQSGSSNTFTFTPTILNNSDKIKVLTTSTSENCSKESNILTMTVNPRRIPEVDISSPITTVCQNNSIKFTATPTHGGSSPSYKWYIDNVEMNGQTSNMFEPNFTSTGDKLVRVEMTSNVTCVDASQNPASNEITVTVNPTLVPTVSISESDNNICPGENITFTATPTNGGTPSYQWKVDGTNVGSNSSTFSSTTLQDNQVVTVVMTATATCISPTTATSNAIPIDVKPAIPAPPSAITGSTQVCPGTVVTYSVTQVAGVKYNWTLPAGWSGTSTTNTIDVTTGNYGQNGSISVTAEDSNDASCGISTAKTLGVSIKPGTPAVPASISGIANICPNTTNTYSISAVPNATSYEWILPNGWTGTSSTTSINPTSNSSGGDIKVKAINDCGTSIEQTLVITIKAGTPATPVNLSGSNTVCPNTSETYTVTNDATATEYIWTLPSGWTGTSTSSSITVNTATSGSGNITVKAKNDCGTSAAASIAVSVKAPAPVMSGTISGPATVCSGSSGLVYTIPAIANADSYIWTLPDNSTITTQTGSISTTIGSSGNISVIAHNDCGDSAPSASFAISSASGVPATPGAITSSLTANSNVCPPLTGITFSVTAVNNATGYNWIMPAGWEITSGANTNSIIARANSNTPFPATQSVKVEATNICGSSTSQSSFDNITIDDHVSATIGADQTVCKATTPITINASVGFAGKKISVSASHNGTGTLNGVPNGKEDNFNFTYTPSQNDINTRTQVTITLTTERPNGACSAGQDEMVIFFKPDPTASISGTTTICTGNATSIIFTGTANTTVTYKKNGGADQTIAIGASGTATLNTGALTATTTYTLGSVRYTTAPNCPKTITGSAVVTITPKPTATISYGASPYSKCLNTDQPVTLTGTGAYTNGSYSSSPSGLILNTTTGGINPSTSTVGTYTVTYTTPASGGCTAAAATTEITIIAVPTITLSYAGTPYCSDNATSPTPNLGGTGNYQGGSYSATSGLSITAGTGAIDIANSTPGNHTVTYSLTPSTGCVPITQTAPVVITEKPTPIIAYSAAEFCKSLSNSQSVNLTGAGIITGGTFTSSPTGLNIDSNGAINPSLSAAGNYTITYSMAAANGCQAVSTTTSLIISDIPSAEISYAGPFCQSDSTAKTVSFSNTAGAYQNGTFSGTAGLSINATSGAITPSTSQSGTHTITYNIPASLGCAAISITTQVVITPVPSATISYTGPFCSSDTTSHSVSFSNTAGAYQNGVFSGTNGLSIAADGSITPSTSSAGNHTITYTIPTADGCQEVVSTTAIEIFEKVLITNQPSNLGICSTQPASFEVIASGDNLLYEWKRTDGTAITNATGINTSILSFNNATATANDGEYFVVVSGSNPCTSVNSDPASLNIDEEIEILKPLEDVTYCENELPEVTFEYVAHANGAPLEFVWIKDNVEIPADGEYTMTTTGPSNTDYEDESYIGLYIGTLTISNLNPAKNGVYQVKIKGPDYFTCQDATSKSFTLSILDQPDPPATAPLTYCQGDVAPALTATGTNLKWYETETGDDLIAGTPTPLTDTDGTTSYWVSQTPSECESARAELIVTIKEKPGLPTTTETLSYCLNEVATPLEASGDSGNIINWYSAVDATTPLGLAPTPDTNTDVTTNYWVSQTKDECESDRVQISITVNPLPILTVSAAEPTICSGTSTTLTATGATTYNWVIKGTTASIGNSASFLISPSSTTIYEVTGTSDKGCTSTAEITVNVDEQSLAGLIDAPERICISNGSATVLLESKIGAITKWEYKNSTTGDVWTETTEVDLSDSRTFTGLTETTSYRVIVKNGVCDPDTSETTVIVDQVPIGGKLIFAKNEERIYLTCEDPGITSLSSISFPMDYGYKGDIVAWRYRTVNAPSWTTFPINGPNFTGETLSAQQIHSLGITETLVFQVEISSGTCSPNAFSETAILSVIPSDIEPAPVTIDPDVLCFGDEVTLSSSTGYGNTDGKFTGGAFDNAGLVSKGWIFRRQNTNTELIFETNANNARPDRWERATRHQFTTRNINTPYNISENLYISSGGPQASGNKGFAIVSSGYDATMETPPFALGSMDQAILTWDQMFNLTPGATIQVEISTDGGASYNTVLYSVSTPPDPTNTTGVSSGYYDGFSLGTIESRPLNKIQVDLGEYMGQQNLRIKFNYSGTRVGDVWAVDNITIPDGPRGVELVWWDYTDELNPIYIGNSETESWTPRKVGYNEFEVRTKLLLDSSGETCTSKENFERVIAFAFDQYVSTTTVVTGSCGTIEAQLSGVVEGMGTVPEIPGPPIIPGVPAQGEISSFPTADGYTAAWTVVGPDGYTALESHFISDSSFDPASTDPNALFKPDKEGTYTLTWTLFSNDYIKDDEGNDILSLPVPVNDGCPPTYTSEEFTTLGCTTLDFDGVNDYVSIQNNFAEAQTVEMWIYPESSTGTIISGPGVEIKMSDLQGFVTSNSRWYHLALRGNDLIVDGIDTGITINGTGTGIETFIGASNVNGVTGNFFSGWIEEVRIWKSSLSLKEIQFMMNQRLDLTSKGTGNAVQGEIIPNVPIAGSYYTDGTFNLDKDGEAFYDETWDNLLGYYRLISAEPDPDLNLIPKDFIPVNGNTIDLSLSSIDGRLYNMSTHQQNTSPTPYFSANDGTWADPNIWLRPDVWDAPNSNGINSKPIDWNIAVTNHNINSGNKEITVLGLKSMTPDKLLKIADPGSAQNETNLGEMLRVTHYLRLDGNIDLVGESQLLQDQGSILDEASKGWLERDQQGQANSFIYNYWSSPVSKTGDPTNNTPYSILDVMKYGTNSNSPTNFNLVNGPFSADDATLNSSTYWFWRFHGLADDYDSWIYIGDNLAGKKLNTGEAHTMKGVDGGMDKNATQNYVYKGKPHNGDITLTINPDENYLIGNPYSSALNGREFILDNIKASGGRNSRNNFNGTIYFWDHFETTNHNLREYIGGYAVLNLLTGVPAASIDERIDNSNPYSGRGNKKIPNKYIPIGQGFFISTVHDAISDTLINIVGGDFTFKNSQRVYKRENTVDGSIFLKPEIPAKPFKETLTNKEEDKIELIRLGFHSPKGYNRQIAVGSHPSTTNGFDMGYDAPMIDYNVEDMYWVQGGNFLVIQGVPDFGKSQVLPIGIRIEKEGEFKIKIDTLENINNDHNIYLKDITLDTIHDIRSGPYISTSAPGEITARFQLIFHKESQQDPVVDEPIVIDEPIIDDNTEISLLHSYTENEMMVLNPQELLISAIYLYDMNGKLLSIFEDVPSEREIRLKIANFSEGVYVLKMHTDNEIVTRKIIIKN